MRGRTTPGQAQEHQDAETPRRRDAARWLLTGATGFLGRHILEDLNRQQHPPEIVALVRNPAEWSALDWIGPLRGVEPLAGDVTQLAARDSALGARHPALGGILHLAAVVSNRRSDAERVHRVNVEGTLNLVRIAAQAGCRLVFVSTSGTVGCFREPGGSADEEAGHREAEVRNWPYYRSKVIAEQRAALLARELGVDLVIVRPPVLLGPGDHRHRSSAHVKRLLDGKVPFVIRGGMHYADVRDVAAALVRLMELPQARPVYHLPGTQCSIEEFYRTVAELAGVRPPRLVVPYRLAWAVAKLSAALGLSRFPEPALVEMASRYWGMHSKYAGEIGYQSRPGRETLRDTIAWLRENPG